MIASIHLIFGALIAKRVNNKSLAWFLAFASHFVLDAIPHSEYSGHSRWWLFLIFDFLIGLIAVFWLTKNETKKNRLKIFIGAILATVPDIFSFSYKLFLPIIVGIPLIGSTLVIFLTKFFAFHYWTHAVPPPTFLFGLLSQLIVVVISFILYPKNKPIK